MIPASTFYVPLSSIALLVGLWIAYWVHSRHKIEFVVKPLKAPQQPLTAYEKISVIVPARNESRNIRRCIEALLFQTYPDFEVIVVDDRSTDDTPLILRELAERGRTAGGKLRILQGKELPPGWAGKPFALHQGAEVAQGDWLCFVDADTFASPELLLSAHAAAREQRSDLFTMLTDQELGSFWEKVVLPLVFTGLSFGFPPSRVNDPEKPDAIANGQFILIKAAVYRAVGGHRAVGERIDEDRALAEAVKSAGYRLFIADGRQLAHTRMYTSLAEMWEGWTKNIYIGLSGRLLLLLFGAGVGLLGALILPLWGISSLLWTARGGGIPAMTILAEAVFLFIFLMIIRMRVSKAFKISPLYAFTLPLGALIFTGMMLASAYKVLSGQGVTWKGRRYKKL